jgi:hypothetical protein
MTLCPPASIRVRCEKEMGEIVPEIETGNIVHVLATVTNRPSYRHGAGENIPAAEHSRYFLRGQGSFAETGNPSSATIIKVKAVADYLGAPLFTSMERVGSLATSVDLSRPEHREWSLLYEAVKSVSHPSLTRILTRP